MQPRTNFNLGRLALSPLGDMQKAVQGAKQTLGQYGRNAIDIAKAQQDTQDAQNRIKLGMYAQNSDNYFKSRPEYSTVNTAEGVYAINSRNPNEKLKLGNLPKTEMTEYQKMMMLNRDERLDRQQQNDEYKKFMDEEKRKQRAFKHLNMNVSNFGDLSPQDQQKSIDYYLNTGLAPKVEDTNWLPFFNDYKPVLPQNKSNQENKSKLTIDAIKDLSNKLNAL
jgi:hypothetical protein